MAEGRRAGASRSLASTSLNLTLQSSRIKEGNAIRWPRGLTQRGVLFDPQFRQLSSSQMATTGFNFTGGDAPVLPKVLTNNLDAYRATRYAVSSLQYSLEDYKNQRGLSLPKVVADLPSERVQNHQAFGMTDPDKQEEGMSGFRNQRSRDERRAKPGWQHRTGMPTNGAARP